MLSRLVWSLLLPVAVAFAADAALAATPLLTVVAAVVCIPLSTLLVSRAALTEMDRVIQQVAPADIAHDEQTPDVERNPGRDAFPADQTTEPARRQTPA